MVSSHRFAKNRRLLNSTQFQYVFDNVDIKLKSRCFTLLARFNEHERSRLGLIVSRKQLRNATQRNRIKRLVRESFRLHPANQFAPRYNVDIIVLVRQPAIYRRNGLVFSELDSLWQTLESRIDAGS